MNAIRNVGAALLAAVSAFAGVRKSGEGAQNLRLWHYAAAGAAVVCIFILILLAVVHSVV